MKVGIYTRISTTDQQTLSMQVDSIKKYVKNRGWEIVLVIEEISSGSKKPRFQFKVRQNSIPYQKLD